MSSKIDAKPFLKWAGGKTQLLATITDFLPSEIYKEETIYVEPFIGSGAMMFYVLNKFPKIKKAIINDVNADLINVYQVVASQPKELISYLSLLQIEYHSLDNKDTRRSEYYYSKRDLFNQRISDKIFQAALFIFLNRTCFNGLYRVNRNNLFNVPMGSYTQPTICDDKNIYAVSEVLKKVEILNGDFEKTLIMSIDKMFFYFDPPYKPISTTSSFNSYSKDVFNDNAQIRLRDFCTQITHLGHKFLLSNSDVNTSEFSDNFFDVIYAEYNISRIKAKRLINSDSSKRGELNELLITNYKIEKFHLKTEKNNFKSELS